MPGAETQADTSHECGSVQALGSFVYRKEPKLAFNYFVAYDLVAPGQNYSAVIERIQSLGLYAPMQFSLFFLQSDLAMVDVHARIREVMDPNDRLAVIWAQDAFVSKYPMSDLRILSDTFQRAA